MSMAERPRYVIAASIATKWHLQGEDHLELALSILNDFLAGRIDLLAPQYLRYEVSRAIFNALRRWRTPATLAIQSINNVQNWGIQYALRDDLTSAAEYANALGISFYDGL